MRNIVAAILFLSRARRHFAKRDAEVDAKPVSTARTVILGETGNLLRHGRREWGGGVTGAKLVLSKFRGRRTGQSH